MEPKYRAEVKFDFDTYLAMSRLFYRKITKLPLMVIAFEVIFVILTIIIYPSALMWVGVAAAVLFPIILYIRIKLLLKKTWESNKSQQDRTLSYLFYEDHVTQKAENGEVTIKYEDIYKILEDKSYICIMISRAQGLVMKKSEVDEALVTFVRGLK